MLVLLTPSQFCRIHTDRSIKELFQGLPGAKVVWYYSSPASDTEVSKQAG